MNCFKRFAPVWLIKPLQEKTIPGIQWRWSSLISQTLKSCVSLSHIKNIFFTQNTYHSVGSQFKRLNPTRLESLSGRIYWPMIYPTEIWTLSNMIHFNTCYQVQNSLELNRACFERVANFCRVGSNLNLMPSIKKISCYTEFKYMFDTLLPMPFCCEDSFRITMIKKSSNDTYFVRR